MSESSSLLFTAEVANTAVHESSPRVGVMAAVTEQDLWNDLLANINEFAVAKAIVDFLEVATPELQLQHTALFLRAKVTIKRNQIAYAEANKAVDNARKRPSAGIVASLDRVLHGFDKRLCGAMLKPMPLGMALAAIFVASLATSVTWLR